MIHWWQTLVGEFLIVTAFIGFSATIALLIELSCANQDRQPQKGADHNQAPAPQTADKVEAPSQSMEKKSEGTQTHQNNAGYTQTRAYAFTYLLTQIIICIAAGFGVPIAIITIGSLNDSISAARQQFDLTERPWVLAIHEVGEPLTFQPATGYASFILKETLQNTGESTAINIGSWADIIPESPMDSFQTSLNRQRQYCDAHRTNPDPSTNGNIVGEILFPKEKTTITSAMALTPDQIAKAKTPDNKITAIIVGCVWYRTVFEPKTAPNHQTRFLYVLAKENGPRYTTVAALHSGIPVGLVVSIEASGTHPELELIPEDLNSAD